MPQQDLPNVGFLFEHVLTSIAEWSLALWVMCTLEINSTSPICPLPHETFNEMTADGCGVLACRSVQVQGPLPGCLFLTAIWSSWAPSSFLLWKLHLWYSSDIQMVVYQKIYIYSPSPYLQPIKRCLAECKHCMNKIKLKWWYGLVWLWNCFRVKHSTFTHKQLMIMYFQCFQAPRFTVNAGPNKLCIWVTYNFENATCANKSSMDLMFEY